MRQAFLIGLFAALVAGCATTSQTERLTKICTGYGHKAGTAGMNQCVAQERKIHHARVDAANAANAAATAQRHAAEDAYKQPLPPLN